MKVLVTGGAGFIGSHLVDALLAGGHAVVAVDDLSLGRLDNLCHLNENKQFRFVQSDILQQDRSIVSFANRASSASSIWWPTQTFRRGPSRPISICTGLFTPPLACSKR